MKARTRIASRLGALAALVLLALFAGVGRAPSAAAGDSDAAGRTITVVGVGSATTTPDRATFAFGVVSRATTATRALAVNAAAIAKVVAALKAAGVAASDIQTTQVELAPRFKNGAAVSYTAASSVRATVRALDRAGAVVDAAVAAGANQVFGPALEPSDADAAYRKALREAVANARAKAQVLAEAAGLTLGPIVHVEETGEGEPASATAAPVAGGLEPGTQAIPASATLTFAVA
jgi:uncharacterized protein YggE